MAVEKYSNLNITLSPKIVGAGGVKNPQKGKKKKKKNY